ncbi:hypothetical protein JOQ06_020540, partial [Pogonophryne albipinna]
AEKGEEKKTRERHINGSQIEEDSACCNLRSLMEFRGFPNEPAADIALKTVKSWIDENPDMPDGPNVLVCQSVAVGQIHPDWMPRSGFAADALTGASIIASPPPGQIQMQSLQKKPCCDPMHQTEAAVMNEAWGPDLTIKGAASWSCCGARGDVAVKRAPSAAAAQLEPVCTTHTSSWCCPHPTG